MNEERQTKMARGIRAIRIMDFIMDNLSAPIIMFDEKGQIEICNYAAKEILGIDLNLSLNEFIKSNNLRYILTPERLESGQIGEFTLTVSYGEKVFLIQGQEIRDTNDNFMGILFLFNDLTGQERLKEEATFHATRDSLTGLWNREYFFEMADKMLGEYPDIRFVMLASDIHQFKVFKDVMGKKMANQLLCTIADGFREKQKELWLFARIAGDRFALLMPKEDYVEDQLLDYVHKIFSQKEYSLVAHNYIGVYEIDDRSIGAECIYDRAYMALESIKGAVGKEIAYYDEEIRKKLIYETTTVEELDQALEEKQFTIYLQPQTDIFTNKVVGCEALVRWISPIRGMVPPSEFIPLFEDHGIISKLDYYVWERACQQLRKWKDEGREELSISVNISAKDFYMTNLFENIVGLVEKYDISPQNLKLEITESAFVLDVKEQMALVKRFQERGFMLEIDDFGSGYSSLNSLKDISVDILKLDMNFFEETDDPKRAERIVESIVQLAFKLGMPVIAEGVETKEQLEMLKSIGCQIVQGYYFSKPLPLEEYERYLEEHPSEDMKVIFNKM